MYGSYQGQDWMDQAIVHLKKQVEIKNLIGQLFPQPLTFPPYPCGQYYYYPTNWQSQYTRGQSNFLNKAFGRSSNLGLAHVAGTAEEGLVMNNNQSTERSAAKYSNSLIALKALACEKCLTVDFIPMLLPRGPPFKEISTHHCRQGRLVEIEQKDSHILKVTSDLLHDNLPRVLAHLVRKCVDTKRIHLCILKLCSNYSPDNQEVDRGALPCPVRFLDTADQTIYRWINRMKESQLEGSYIQLDINEELFSFFKVSIDSTIILLATKAHPSSGYDLYVMGLVLDESCLEKVKPFMPKLLQS
jgi:hypothetical protein